MIKEKPKELLKTILTEETSRNDSEELSKYTKSIINQSNIPVLECMDLILQ